MWDLHGTCIVRRLLGGILANSHIVLAFGIIGICSSRILSWLFMIYFQKDDGVYINKALV